MSLDTQFRSVNTELANELKIVLIAECPGQMWSALHYDLIHLRNSCTSQVFPTRICFTADKSALEYNTRTCVSRSPFRGSLFRVAVPAGLDVGHLLRSDGSAGGDGYFKNNTATFKNDADWAVRGSVGVSKCNKRGGFAAATLALGLVRRRGPEWFCICEMLVAALDTGIFCWIGMGDERAPSGCDGFCSWN